MIKKCTFAEHRICELWIDYQVTSAALAEADELCHQNWTAIQHQQDYIDLLKSILTEHNIDVPPEY